MMKNQRGAISGAVIALITVLGIIGLVCAIGFSSYVNAYNYGNTMENTLKATQDNNRNILAQYGQKVQEIAQVPAMYVDDLTKLTTAAIQGRYGADGSKATFQFLKEQNPTLDPKMYTKIQQVMEIGRDNFQNNQTRLVDQRRQYETKLGSFWEGMWLRMAGYPKVNLKDFDIVSTDRADTAFKNHKEDGIIKLR